MSVKDRRPRKRKKELKRKFEKVQASRMVMTALVTASSAFRLATIVAYPRIFNLPPSVFAAEKAIKTIEVTKECTEAIANIMNTGPKNWREA